MSSSKPSVHPYSLPDLTETKLSVEDDWTKVKDRKEKKRIQNRVAQRTYRHRMKARLGELQEKLEYHERNKGSSITYGGAPGVGESEDTKRSPSVQLPTPAYTTDDSPSPEANALIVFDDIHLHNSHNSHVFHTDTSQLFDLSPVIAPLTAQPPGVFTVGQSHITNGGYSSAVVPEYLHLQMQPFDTQHRAADGQADNYALDVSALGDDLFLVHDRPHLDPLLYSIERPDTMTKEFAQESESKVLNWKIQPSPTTPNPDQVVSLASSIAQDLPEMNKTRTPNRTTCSTTTSAAIDQKAPKQHQQPAASLPTKRPTLDERMESVMERVETEGFGNFDSLATLYYKAKFGDASSLAVEQRLSRNRRLPKLFADIFSAAQEWGAREQRPLFDEILKMSEGMLIGEARGVHSTLHASIGGLARSAKDHESGKSAVPGLKRLMEDNLPNLWALITALATENRAVRQRDRSNTVLATILVLQCSGQLPKQSLMALLDACL